MPFRRQSGRGIFECAASYRCTEYPHGCHRTPFSTLPSPSEPSPVRAINADVRLGLQERGRLARGDQEDAVLGRERVYRTNDGAGPSAVADASCFSKTTGILA